MQSLDQSSCWPSLTSSELHWQGAYPNGDIHGEVGVNIPTTWTLLWGTVYSDNRLLLSTQEKHRDMGCQAHLTMPALPTLAWHGFSWPHQSLSRVSSGFPLLSDFPPAHRMALGKESLCGSKQQKVILLLCRKITLLNEGVSAPVI